MSTDQNEDFGIRDFRKCNKGMVNCTIFASQANLLQKISTFCHVTQQSLGGAWVAVWKVPKHLELEATIWHPPLSVVIALYSRWSYSRSDRGRIAKLEGSTSLLDLRILQNWG